MKNLKYILIIVVVIIIMIVIMSFTPGESKEDTAKKNEINNVFAIWMNVAGTGDKQTLTRNELPIKKDLFNKLNAQEVLSLKNYSMALQNLLSVKGNVFDPLFINSLSYLTNNFGTTKTIIGKTSASGIFSKIGFSGVGPMPSGGIN